MTATVSTLHNRPFEEVLRDVFRVPQEESGATTSSTAEAPVVTEADSAPETTSPPLSERRAGPRRSPRRQVADTLLQHPERRERPQSDYHFIDPTMVFGLEAHLHTALVEMVRALRGAGITPLVRVVIEAGSHGTTAVFSMVTVKGPDDSQRIKLTGVGGEGVFGLLFDQQEVFRDELLGDAPVKEARIRVTEGLQGFLLVWRSLL